MTSYALKEYFTEVRAVYFEDKISKWTGDLDPRKTRFSAKVII